MASRLSPTYRPHYQRLSDLTPPAVSDHSLHQLCQDFSINDNPPLDFERRACLFWNVLKFSLSLCDLWNSLETGWQNLNWDLFKNLNFFWNIYINHTFPNNLTQIQICLYLFLNTFLLSSPQTLDRTYGRGVKEKEGVLLDLQLALIFLYAQVFIESEREKCDWWHWCINQGNRHKVIWSPPCKDINRVKLWF